MQDFGQNTSAEHEFEAEESDFGRGPRTDQAIADGSHEYLAGLPTWRLIIEVRRLMAAECRVERLVCRYLADLADRVRERSDVTLMGYADEFDAIRCCFGLKPREARERLRVGRALRRLPRLEQAFIAGELAYSRVREVTRIATPQTELEWLERAQQMNMRELERRVAGPVAPMPPEPIPPPAGEPAPSRPSLRVSFELSVEAWTLVQRALQQVRDITGSALSDGEALEVLARGALARAASVDPEGVTTEVDPARHQVAGASLSENEPPRPDGSMGDAAELFPELQATQGGSSGTAPPPAGGEPASSARERQLVAIGALPEEPAARALLRLMGDRQGWTTDELMEASGWSYREVCCALVQLEIGDWVHRDFFSWLIVKTQRSRLAG